MNAAAIFYFVIIATDVPFPPTQIGPLTAVGCAELQANMPKSIPSVCRKVIGMKSCNDPAHPWMGVACPVFEGEEAETGRPK